MKLKKELHDYLELLLSDSDMKLIADFSKQDINDITSDIHRMFLERLK